MTSHQPYEQAHHSYEQTYQPYEQAHHSYEQAHHSYEQAHHSYEQVHHPYEQTHHNYGLEHNQSPYSPNHYDVNHAIFRVGNESSGHPNPGVSLDTFGHSDKFSDLKSGDQVYVRQHGVEYIVTIYSVTSSGFTVKSNDGVFEKTIEASEIESRA